MQCTISQSGMTDALLAAERLAALTLASLSERSAHCYTRPYLAALGAPRSAYTSDLQCSVPANAERYLALDLYSAADALGCQAVAPLQVLAVLEGPGEE